MNRQIKEESGMSGKNRGSDSARGYEGEIGTCFSETEADERDVWKIACDFPSSERNMRAV
jgi:hypothetical protein